MTSEQQSVAARRSGIVRFAWVLTGGLSVFTVENIWIDSWMKSRFHRFASLVPDPLSGTWFLVFALCAIGMVLLATCTTLVARNSRLPIFRRASLGTASCVVLILVFDWYRVTTGQRPILPDGRSHRFHSVVLTWNPSSSKVAGYNVYRSLTPGGHYHKLNTSLLEGPSYTDTSVENGAVYCYTARAVDVRGHESVNSNEVWVTIPR